MDSAVKRLVRDWAAGAIHGVGVQSPAHVHLELTTSLGAALECLCDLIGSGVVSSDIVSVLLFPLEPAEELVTTTPNVRLESRAVHEPPSIYLLHIDAFSQVVEDEVYSRPFDVSQWCERDDLWSYYQCRRSAACLAFDEPEFDRTLVTEYWHPRRRLL